jgi:hypothetical protein
MHCRKGPDSRSYQDWAAGFHSASAVQVVTTSLASYGFRSASASASSRTRVFTYFWKTMVPRARP